jgi:hypothetical protein
MSDPERRDTRFLEILAVTLASDDRKHIWSSRQIARAVRAFPSLAPTFSERRTGLAQSVARALCDFRCARYRECRRHILWLLPDVMKRGR